MLNSEEITIDELPGALREMAEAIENRMHGYDNALRQAVLDFERGMVTLPELVRLAKEELPR